MSWRILVVDDEIPLLELMREGLSAEGFVVDGAATAAEALELVRTNLYDAAILDFALPDMNGVMLHHRIRQMDRELGQRTLFISGQTQSADDLGYFSSAGSGFLPKPFDMRAVLDGLHRLLEGEEAGN